MELFSILRARNWIRNRQSVLEENLKATGEASSQNLQKMIALLDSTFIASVALDSSSVFHQCEDYGMTNKLSLKGNNSKTLHRKSIKEKAVEAMLQDGVDISSYVPNTVEEIITSLPMLKSSECIAPVAESTEMLDKLIVLCSCGDEMKYKLVRRSKSVEEWSIDAPTKASIGGEGDTAYLRVSKEIRDEVNILMTSLVGDTGIEVS